MKKVIIGIICVALAIAVILIVWNVINGAPEQNPAEQNPVEHAPTETQAPTDQHQATNNSDQVQTDKVAIVNFAYSPQTIHIKKGATVTWTNEDTTGHTVTSDNNSEEAFSSPLLAKGQTFSYTFNKAGTFNYFCEPHPQMTGTVIVTE